MKTDRFEDLLRKKLENYTPDYREQDLDRMFSHIQRHTAPSFWSQYGKIFMNSVVGLTTAGLIFIVFYQNNQNQKLNDKIVLLQNQAPKQEVITKTDTVYVYIKDAENQDSRFEKKNLGGSKLEVTKSKDLNFESRELRAENQALKREIEKIKTPIQVVENGAISEKGVVSKKTNTDSETKTISFNQNKNLSENSSELRSDAEDKDVLSSNQPTYSSNQSIKEGESDFITKSGNSENYVSNPSNQNSSANPIESKIVLNSLIIKDLKTYSSVYDISDNQIKTRYFSPTRVAVRRPRYDYNFPDISLKNMRYRIGGSISGRPENVGIALNNELMLNKNLSVSFGISKQKIEGEEFKNDRQYDYKYGKYGTYTKLERGMKEKRDFRDSHLPNFPPINEIRDIHLHSEITSIPVAINYRFSLIKDFRLLFGVGTELDFSVKERARFDFVLPNPLIPQNENLFETTQYNLLQPTTFNNLSLSVGVERQFGHYVFQLSPYIITKIKDIKYRPNDLDFGFRFNAFYQFGKKK